jgi:hypothetical protein
MLKNIYLASCYMKGNVIFKELSHNIMVNRNSNWLKEIVWYKTSYAKENILSLFEHPT